MPECQNCNNTSTIIDGQNTPQWLTKEYMEQKLRIFYKDPRLKVQSITLRSAIGKGENYGGVLIRASVQYTIRDVLEPKIESYIVKSSLEYNDFASLFEPYDIFNREMNVYQTILPKLTALLEEIGDTEQMFPVAVAVDRDNSSIIFKDLTEKKFTMCDRMKGLDIDHAKKCLRKLAKMHATSAVLNEREPGIFASYDRGFFNRHTDSFSAYFTSVLNSCGRIVGQWEGFEEYGRKLTALVPKVMEYAKQVFDLTDGHLNVFAHGDFWINNVMFNYNEENQPNDAVLLDFQYSCWGSPAIDLHYFLNTSLEENLCLNKQDELIQYYYGVLAETLRSLCFRGQIPSLHRFHICLAEKAFYAFTSTCLVQPLQINENPESATFDVLLGKDERSLHAKSLLYQNTRVQKNLRTWLPIFDRMGLLDQRD